MGEVNVEETLISKTTMWLIVLNIYENAQEIFCHYSPKAVGDFNSERLKQARVTNNAPLVKLHD